MFENKSTLTKRRDTYPFIDPFRFRNKLRGKVVIITLAHRGIGRASAFAFADAGASVCLLGPSNSALEPVVRQIKEKYNTPTLALVADLMKPEAPKTVVELVEKHLGPVDILVNIISATYLRPFSREPDILQNWWPYLESNLRVPITLIHACLPSMIARKSGIIISTTSAAGLMELPWMSEQGVASAALIKFHSHLETENRTKGILNFAVNPGPIPSHVHDPKLPLQAQFQMDEKVLEEERDVQAELVNLASTLQWASVGLASGTIVALCAEPRAEILSGHYVNAERDLGEVLAACESNRGRMKAQRLYELKVDEI